MSANARACRRCDRRAHADAGVVAVGSDSRTEGNVGCFIQLTVDTVTWYRNLVLPSGVNLVRAGRAPRRESQHTLNQLVGLLGPSGVLAIVAGRPGLAAHPGHVAQT